jgi:hypothetical protein
MTSSEQCSHSNEHSWHYIVDKVLVFEVHASTFARGFLMEQQTSGALLQLQYNKSIGQASYLFLLISLISESRHEPTVIGDR